MSKVSRYISTEWDKIECPHSMWIPDYEGIERPKHITPSEFFFHSPLHPLIASVFDAAREKWEAPILVTSGVRCWAYQEVLRQKGLRTAEVSPHIYGTALDIMPYARENERNLPGDNEKDLAIIIHEIDANIRIYVARYAFKFIHLDCAYLLPDPLPDGRAKPESWKEGVRDFP